MAGRERRRLCKFLSDWTVHDQFSSWLTPVKGDNHKAYCLLCKKVFAVSHGGLNDVKAHYKGKRHIWLQLQQQESVEDTSNLWEGHKNFRSKNKAQNIVFNEQSNGFEESIGLNPFEDESFGYDSSQHATPTEYWELDDFKSNSTPSFVSGSKVPDEPTPKKHKMNSHPKMLPQQYCLRWKYHHNNLQVMFSQLLERESYCDVTIACEGKTLRAHKMVLSACSTYFDAIFSQHEERNPIVILKDVKFSDIKALIEFMYKGEINVDNSHLTSLLKTAEDLHIKGLAEVSWRSDSTVGQPVVDDDVVPVDPPLSRVESRIGNGSDAEPPLKRRRGRPLLENDTFSPMVTSVTGAAGTENAFTVSNIQEPIELPEDEIEEATLDDSEPEVLSDDYGGEEDVHNLALDPLNDTEPPEPSESTPSSESLLQRIADQYRDVVQLNDYLTTGRRQQFWEEPFTRRVMEAIKGKELEMKVGAELLGVSYGTLYGRYRDAYGCLKHPYRVRDFWSESGPADILAKVQRKEITLFRAAEMLNVTVTTLANYLSTLRQPGSGDEVEPRTAGQEADDDDDSVEEMSSAAMPGKSDKMASLQNISDLSATKQGVTNHEHHQPERDPLSNNLDHSDNEPTQPEEVNGTTGEVAISARYGGANPSVHCHVDLLYVETREPPLLVKSGQSRRSVTLKTTVTNISSVDREVMPLDDNERDYQFAECFPVGENNVDSPGEKTTSSRHVVETRYIAIDS